MWLARGDDWIIVDKPSGIAVHRSAMCPDDDVMLTRVRDAIGHYVYPAHRLDRATSGCLAFGLTPEGARKLQEALRDGSKTYLALVRGQADRYDGTLVDRPLANSKGSPPKEAQTRVEVLHSAAQPRCSLVVARPRTGRFHQIRRHLNGLGHPVLGDSSHGDTRENRLWREDHGLTRLFLHCARMQLPHEDGPIDVHAPLPPELQAVLDPLPFAALAEQSLARVRLTP